jgi:DNA-binding IclR family transcriptional regulator
MVDKLKKNRWISITFWIYEIFNVCQHSKNDDVFLREYEHMSGAQGVNSVEVAVSIMDVIAEFDGPVRAVDIARIAGMSNSRLHKYLVSLCRSNLVYQDPQTSLYSLSHKLSQLAYAVEKQNGLFFTINNALCHLTEQINISTGLVVKKDDFLSLRHYNRSNRNIEIDYRLHSSVPLMKSASGKVFLAFSDDYQGGELLPPEKKRQIVEQGYATRRYQTEGIPGARSIACPVFNEHNRLVAAAVVMGFLPEAERELHKIAQLLIETIRQLKLSVRPKG